MRHLTLFSATSGLVSAPKFSDSLVFHISSSFGPFYSSQTILEREESQLQIMSFGLKMISTLSLSF